MKQKQRTQHAKVVFCGTLILLAFAKESYSFQTTVRRISSPPLSYTSSWNRRYTLSPNGNNFQSRILLSTSTKDENNLNELHTPKNPAKLSRLESEFNSMMDHFASYTPRDTQSISNLRTRALFEGVAAGANEPAVRRAFTILFEDMAPIRVAGRMIYRHLSDVMRASLDLRKEEDGRIISSTGFNLQDIDVGRDAFMALKDDTDEAELTMEQLVESGVVETAVSLFGYDDFSQFITHMESDEYGRLSFERFMYGLQRCAADSSCSPECNVSHILQELANQMKPIEELKSQTSSSQRKRKHSDKYDAMLVSFSEWEEKFDLDTTSRRDEILKGCFVGAKNEYVVRALKIVYTDYAALRVAGDIIFKLMSKLIGSKKKKRKAVK